jgi:hypothetical protein
MQDSDPNVQFRDVAPAIEFVCWVVLIMPVLRAINGPAVTDDQFAFQIILFVVALVGATSLRCASSAVPGCLAQNCVNY